MPLPEQNVSDRQNKRLTHLWWISLILAIGVALIAIDRRVDRTVDLSEQATWSTARPQIDVDSPTGLENGQRSLIVTGHHIPSFGWIRDAQLTLSPQAETTASLSDDDAANRSRTSPYKWWLVSVGSIRSLLLSEPVGYAIERGALLADPILFLILLVGGTIYVARFISPLAAIGYSIATVSAYPLSSNFVPGAPDAHALAWTLAMASVLPLFAKTSLHAAQRKVHFAVAGSFCGLAIWNDANSQTPVLVAILLGGIAYELTRFRGQEPKPETQSNWGIWTLFASSSTIAASFIEHGSEAFTWSLESINPIHGLILLGIGSVLHATSSIARKGLPKRDRTTIAYGFIGLLLLSLWPMAAGLSDGISLLAPDFYAREMANHPAGGIANNLSAWMERSIGFAKLATLLPVGLFFVLAFQLFAGKPSQEAKGRFLFAASFLFLLPILASIQLRWWNLFDIFAILALTVLLAELPQRAGFSQFKPLALLLVFLPGLAIGFPPSHDKDAPIELSATEAQQLVERDFAYWLRKRSGEGEINLFSSPIFSSGTAYYGGFRAVATTADEAGQQAAVRIASAGSAQEASILLKTQGVTHIALPLWDPMLEQLVRIGLQIPPGQELPPNAFAIALRDWEVPGWLRTLNYQTPDKAPFKNYRIASFTLSSEQDPALSLSRLADIFVENGQLWEARSIRGALVNYPRDINALSAIANIDYALNNREDLARSMENLIPYLSRRSARNLPADRRINLASLFIRTGRTELAREQLHACLQELDTDTLRLLTPTATASLLYLSRTLNIAFPSPEMRAKALSFVPPALALELEK